MGAAPDFAFNGREAVDMALRKDYDVILMDIQMPELDGLEATRCLRTSLQGDKRPHIVALTAHARPEDAEACSLAGMDAHLTKPLKAPDLFKVLTDICAERHHVEQA
ncbi:MAG TPA: response regulator [Opitutales bacterium]|nr:response regulator [Opitutales bacterium]